MDETNFSEATRPVGGSFAAGAARRFVVLLRRSVFAVGLGAMGLIVTPVGIFLSGSLLFWWRRFPDVAQGFYSALTIFGLAAAPLGAIYWLVAGAWMAARGGRASKDRGAHWRVLITVYMMCLLAIAAFIGLTRR